MKRVGTDRYNYLGLVKKNGRDNSLCEYASVQDFLIDLARRFYYRTVGEGCAAFLLAETCMSAGEIDGFMHYWLHDECEESECFPTDKRFDRQMLFLLRIIKSYCRYFANLEIVPGSLYDQLEMAFHKIWLKAETDFN